jgi:hypothetical protein
MPRKSPLTLPSPPGEGEEGLSGKRGVWPKSNGEKNSLSWGRGKGEGPSFKSVSWLKSEKLILVLPTDFFEDPLFVCEP